METIQWENIDMNNFNIFMRDLTYNNNINLKHQIEDLLNKNLIINKKDKKKKNIIKKKDLIIMEQEKKRNQKIYDDDKQKIEYLLTILKDNNIYDNFDKIKTKKYKQIYKLELLNYFVKKQKKKNKKKDYMPDIINLYMNIKYCDNEFINEDEKYKKISKKIEKILDDTDYKLYMMKELSNLLPPLNFWNRGEFEFDDWQKELIYDIKDKKSILVKAPTSSGKSFIAMSTGIIHNKILYVCPSKPVAYQVGSKYIKMGYKVHYLVENMGYLSYYNKTNIFIGTPDIIEKYLFKLKIDFDYTVFDEIHNIDENISYENIIKIVDSNFLALSATIKNIERLKEIFNKIHPNKDIKYIEYKKRFINQQRWIFNNNKLNKLHPITCYDIENPDIIDNISFSPNDSIILYEKLEEEIEDLDIISPKLSPDNYFQEDKLLTLDDTKDYENQLKNELKRLSINYKQEILKIQKDLIIDEKLSLDNDIISLFKICKEKDLLPMIYFHPDEESSKEIFMNLYDLLQDNEKENYPYHYDILKKKDELYKKYKDKRYNYETNMKLKSSDVINEKIEKMNEFDKNEKNNYILNIRSFYEKCINNCKKNNYNKICINNLKKELNEFMISPDFREQDIFKKHSEYSFVRGDPMSGSEIREIRLEIKKTTGLLISYENPIFQLLKRGIGLYISSMPDEYNWILQKLINQKKLGIIISDKTLCLGVDLPIRSVCLSGYNNVTYTNSDYLQMTGRAGRRGHDNQGNIIFHDVKDYKNLMSHSLPEINGSDKYYSENYSIINKINKNIQLTNFNWRINKDIKIIKMNEDYNISEKYYKLLWNLRYYKNNIDLINKLDRIEKKLFLTQNKEFYLLELIINSLFNDIEYKEYELIYKSNVINNDINNKKKILYDIANIIKDLINSLDNTFTITKKTSIIIFNNLKTIIYKYEGFN
jgi:superfamily II RNA helicase